MILITGATGGLGKETINGLLKKIPAKSIAALVRDKNKAAETASKGVEIRIGDYDDYQSLVKAFSGIEKILCISAAAFSDRVAQEKNVIDAAVAAGVKKVLFTSIQRNENSKWIIPYVTNANLEVEEYLKASGLGYTILKNTLYSDTLPFLLGDVTTKVQFPAGQGKVAFATRANLGEGIAQLLLDNEYENQSVTLCNSSAWSFADVAAKLSVLSSGAVKYHDIPREAYVAQKEAIGLPAIAANFAADWADAVKQGEFETPSPVLEKLLGRKPTTLGEFLKEAFFAN